MTYEHTKSALLAAPSIDAVIAAHGARKVLAAAVAALLRGKKRKTHPPDSRGSVTPVLHLSAHVMRDIGLDRGNSGDFHRFL